MRVGLLSGQVFSTFGEDWLAGSHGGGGITSGMSHFSVDQDVVDDDAFIPGPGP